MLYYENLKRGQLAELRKRHRERSGKGRKQLQCKLQPSSSLGRDRTSSCSLFSLVTAVSPRRNMGGKKLIDKIACRKTSVLSPSPFTNSIQRVMETSYKTAQMPMVGKHGKVQVIHCITSLSLLYFSAES